MKSLGSESIGSLSVVRARSLLVLTATNESLGSESNQSLSAMAAAVAVSNESLSVVTATKKSVSGLAAIKS